MMRQEDHFVLDDEDQHFQGATLQIISDGGTGQSGLNENEKVLNGSVEQSKKIKNETSMEGPKSLAVVPWSGDCARDFFSYRIGLVTQAIRESKDELLTEDDGDVLGSWLLTEITFWDNEKERLVLLTSKSLLSIKYDFIALKVLDWRRINLDWLDTVVMGELSYPPASLIPSRNMNGVRLEWRGGQPLSFVKKWNPFEKNIPLATFTSHPLLWRRDTEEQDSNLYNIDDFTQQLTPLLDRRVKNFQCTLQHKPILLENYLGVGALIHNKNSLGFFKVRGKFSF